MSRMARFSAPLSLPWIGLVTILAFLVSPSRAAPTTVFTVNAVSGDDGTCDAAHCSLKEALDAADAGLGADIILFNIPGVGPHLINLGQYNVSDALTIDGYSQPGSSPATASTTANLKVEVNTRLFLTADNITVKGMALYYTNGIAISPNGADNITIQGNFIGTDATGGTAKGTGDGIFIYESSNNTIGGSAPADRNLISGNLQHGISVSSISSTNNLIQGNTIVGNGLSGIQIDYAAGNEIRDNIIGANGGQGIELGLDGPTPNDAGDGDSGANNLQNYPVLAEVTSDAVNGTIITGTLNSVPSTAFDLQFFANSRCDESGYGEGERYLFDYFGSTDPSGNMPFAVASAQLLGSDEFVTATAIDPNGNTSEFSPCALVNQASAVTDLFVSMSDDFDPVVAGTQLTYQVLVGNNGPSHATAVILTDTLPAGSSLATFSSTHGACAPVAGDVICDLYVVHQGETAFIDVTVVPLVTGVLTTNVAVAGASPETSTINNSVSETTVVSPSLPTTFVVNSTIDEVDSKPGDQLCEIPAFPGVCTLRAAIQEANYLPSDDTVIVPPGLYTLAISGTLENLAASGDLDITDDLTILGGGAAATIIDGDGIDRVFHNCPAIGGPTIKVSMSGVTISGGNGDEGTNPALGGGIWNSSCSDLALSDSIISDNAALDGEGGGILTNGGVVTLTGTTVLSNTAQFGGGISNIVGTLILTNTNILSNTGAEGGGIWSNGPITVSSSIVGWNVADNTSSSSTSGSGGGLSIRTRIPYPPTTTLWMKSSSVIYNKTEGTGMGGGIYSDSGVGLWDTSVLSNTSDIEGAGIYSDQGSRLDIFRSTIAYSQGTGGDGVVMRGDLYLGNSTISSNTGSAIYLSHWLLGTCPSCSRVATTLILENTTIARNGKHAIEAHGSADTIMEASVLTDNGMANFDINVIASYTPTLFSLGYNLDDDGSANLSGTGDVSYLSAYPGPLQDNGGRTETHELSLSSVVDAIPPADCLFSTDQRGVPRPLGAGCDMGAYESAKLAACSFPDLTIPDATPAGITDTVTVTNTGVILDLEAVIFITHTFVGDISVSLHHVDTGVSVNLIDRPGVPVTQNGCSGDNISAWLDDEASSDVEDECAAAAPTIDGIFRPNSPLSLFDGDSWAGTWQLTVSDQAASDIGTLGSWCVTGDYFTTGPTTLHLTSLRASEPSSLSPAGLAGAATLSLITLVAFWRKRAG